MKLKEKITVPYIRVNLRLLAAISKKRAAQKALRLFCTPFNKSKRRTTPLFHKAEKLHLRVENKKVIGYRWNHSQPKKVLIIHGFQSAAKKFELYVTPLLNKGYEVLAFDAHAHGESEGDQINVLEYKNLIEVVCNKYGPIDAFIAHSFGGLAISLALENIIHTDKTKLVLIAPATETRSAVDLLFQFLRLNNDIRDEFENLIVSIGGKTTAWLSISRAIKNIRAQILWIHDEDDHITPLSDVLKVKENNYPNIEYYFTQGLGHSRIYRDSTVKKKIFSFL